MKLSTRILAFLLMLVTCLSFLFEAVLAADETDADLSPSPVAAETAEPAETPYAPEDDPALAEESVDTPAPEEPATPAPTDAEEEPTPSEAPETPVPEEAETVASAEEPSDDTNAPAESEAPTAAETPDVIEFVPDETLVPSDAEPETVTAEATLADDAADSPSPSPSPSPTPTASPTPTPSESPEPTPASTPEPTPSKPSYTDATPLVNTGTPVSGGKWKTSGGKKYYVLDDANLTNGFYQIGDKTYYFDSKGVMKTGWLKISYTAVDGTSHTSWCYFSSKGVRKESGWQKKSGNWTYFVNGFALSDCLYMISGKYYHFDSDGFRQTGWVKYTTRDESGALVKVWSWFDSKGVRKEKGWKKTSNKWYYIVDGIRVTDTDRKISGDYYHFDSKGVMTTGWLKVTYTDDDGAVKKGYRYYNSDGIRYNNGSYKIGSYYYYFKDTIRQTGWITTAKGDRYYANSKGHLRTGWWKNNGKYYYFGAKGKMQTGWCVIDGDTYYFYTGKEAKGGEKFTMARSTKIDGIKINKNGVATTGAKKYMILESANHTSATNYLIMVDTKACKLGIFKRSGDGWKLSKYWSCAPGKDSTPTRKGGLYITGDRGYYFDSGAYRCYWYTTFYANSTSAQAFHSVLYYPSGYLADGRVGMKLSHGCVRLLYSNAKWLHDNIPTGTGVYIY